MENFDKKEIRMAPRTELKRQQNYMDLLPRPIKEEYQLLKESIEREGIKEALKINDDGVVLDGYTRLEIADELDIEWVPVQTLEFEDHFEEKLFIITTNLVRRHLDTGQRAAVALRFLDIEKEKAKERQRQAGELIGKDNLKKGQQLPKVSDDSQLRQDIVQAGSQGRAMDVLARKFDTNRESLRQAQKIREAAQTDPEVAEGWDKVQKGEATVNQVYQQVQAKAGTAKKKEKKPKKEPAWKAWVPEEPEDEETYIQKMFKKLPDPPPAPDHALMHVIYGLAGDEGISREEVDAIMAFESAHYPTGESFILAGFRWWSQKMLELDQVWGTFETWLDRWRRHQRALRPEEIPLPDDSKKLGPWALDFVHQAQLEDLVREFPAESAHLIYSDAVVADAEQIGLLGEFAARALTEGKHLCVYLDKRLLPEAMARLSAAGLTYHWCCSVFRPEDKGKVVGTLLIREKWRMLLIYRKGEGTAASAWYPDEDGEGVHLGQAESGGWDWFDDAVEERRPSNRGMVRQLLKGLTMKGQMVVDPFVGSGITGQVARSLERRFLCFGAQEEDVRAANQRIAEMRLVEETSAN